MKTQYLIRLDDACPKMHQENWQKMIFLLQKYGIKPLIGIIPNNEDPDTSFEEDTNFWDKAREWQNYGYAIALHGFNHVCKSLDSGVNPIHNRSEFAGLSLEEQSKKIRDGYTILKKHGIEPCCFFAPSHTYDNNTILALKKETTIRIINDTIARYPYYQGDIVFVPCQMGLLRDWHLGGIVCACYHPNIMEDSAFYQLECFIKSHLSQFISFDSCLVYKTRRRSIFDRLLSKLYFVKRRLNHE